MSDINVHSGIRKGLAWSAINAFVLRLGTVGVGIFLARLLSPEQFGVFAIALTVQAVLMTLADFGLSTDLIRSPDYARKAPTVATLGIVTGTSLTVIMVISAQGTAQLLGSPEAGPVIAVMSGTLFLAGCGVVPYAKLQRNFMQKQLFAISLADFVIGTIVTVLLILGGWGVMALAISRVVAQCVTLILQFVLAREKPHFGLDRSLVSQVLAFGIPVAGANMLSWVLLNADNVVVSRLAGPTALGFYFLAFNISSWPMNAIGQIVRSVSLPAFARVGISQKRVLSDAMAPTWAITLFAGLMLGLLAAPVIELVYGQKWLAAVPILAVLGIFGALRTIFDLGAAFLLANGRSTIVLVVQAAWLGCLVPFLIVGTIRGGTVGAAVAHLLCATLVVLPGYCWALSHAGVRLRPLWAAFWPPLAAAAPTAVATILATSIVSNPLTRLMVGGCVGCFIYGACIGHWLRRRLVVAGNLGTGQNSVHVDASTPSINTSIVEGGV
ncbi:lipopolysaccharide biosynthesis protein [Paeniglutamicibacter gangotriensis]|uniref:Lipopolysaccharide biosynthesis protein n=1 Tax=Paeniglutamicibacter gangotriensis TaxID=254787 RepID=A0A5B0EFW3_9MICC|nr:lipopolysaccharide biosynthesis protein [Paeniglutamicibacter gangotriensis]KAA0977548.1 lipopolysaccharide biosynthesis protein [Paeniglutamicibacter gangotriensis]